MNHSLRVLFERFLFWLICFAAPLFLLSVHTGELRREQVRLLCDALISDVSAVGTLTRDRYERFMTALEHCAEGCHVEFTHTAYCRVPVYEYASEETITQYYAERNQREAFELHTDAVFPKMPVMQDAKLQKDSNASVLGGGAETYVPLPKEEGGSEQLHYVAMQPRQEVYIGEELITVCMAETPEGYYQIVADAVSLQEEGTKSVSLSIHGIPIPVSIEVTVYPRELTCLYGHRYACTAECVEYKKKTGVWAECPFCQVTVSGLSFFPDTLVTTIGTGLQETELSVIVSYQDGHTQTLHPGAEGLIFDYDAFYCGVQKVKASYRGFLAEGLTIFARGGVCMECGSVCQQKGYADYSQNPFCSSCFTSIPVFLGKNDIQEECFGTEQIADCLEQQGGYEMKRGDTLSVRVDFIQEKFLAPVWTMGQIRTEKE